jgi:hypothetical protein
MSELEHLSNTTPVNFRAMYLLVKAESFRTQYDNSVRITLKLIIRKLIISDHNISEQCNNYRNWALWWGNSSGSRAKAAYARWTCIWTRRCAVLVAGRVNYCSIASLHCLSIFYGTAFKVLFFLPTHLQKEWGALAKVKALVHRLPFVDFGLRSNQHSNTSSSSTESSLHAQVDVESVVKASQVLTEDSR